MRIRMGDHGGEVMTILEKVMVVVALMVTVMACVVVYVMLGFAGHLGWFE